MPAHMKKSVLISLSVLAVLCIALVSIAAYMASGYSDALSNALTANIKSRVANVKVLILTATTGSESNLVQTNVASVLRQYFSNAQILDYDTARSMKTNIDPDVLILIPNNGLIPEDDKVILIAKKILANGKLLIITSGTRPLSNLMLIHFLQRLGIDQITLDNIKSAIYEKDIGSSRGEHVYVFALSLTDGKYPSMYILSVENGARITPTSICSYIINTVSDFLKQKA